MRAFIFLALLLNMNTAMTETLELTIDRVYDAPALMGKTLSGLKVSPDGTRVTFLRGKESDQYQLDLWEYHIADANTKLLVDSSLLVAGAEILSDQEKARRERTRTASFKGILEYDFSPDGKKLLFPLNGEIYLYDLAKGTGRKPRKLTEREHGFITDARVSPKGKYVSFVRNQDLWVVELESGRALPLTDDGGGLVSNGLAEFMAQEEMGRNTGYWWAPDDSAIAFTRVDENLVPVQRRFEIHAENTEVIEQRYPAAGQANASIQLGVIAMETVMPAIVPVHWIDLGNSADIYLARVAWSTDGSALSYQIQSRNQRRLDLRLWSRTDTSVKTLLSEISTSWVNLHNDLHFLKDRSGFVWSSEREGYKRLYLHAMDGTVKYPLTPKDWVVDELLAVSKDHERIYFASGGFDPLQKQVYWVPLLSPTQEATQLTRSKGIHNATFANTAEIFVAIHSSPTSPPAVRLYAADGKEIAVLEANALTKEHAYWPYYDQHAVPEFGLITGAEGQKLYYRLTKPSDFEVGKKYPVLLYVYGGPRVQKVQKAWDDPLVQVMARRGYIVFSIDNRGSARRGKIFEEALFRHLGGVEVIDQLEGVKWLKSQAFVDPERIGVFGWSYGGYMSLMLLAKASDQFACGVAGAPVTDWSLYDTHYTERYMDHPQDNADGYHTSSIFTHLDGLTVPVFLVHGMADDNVLFTHTTKLMSALQERGIAFELMTYPGGKHGIALPWMKKHAYNAIIEFFERKLKNLQPAKAAEISTAR